MKIVSKTGAETVVHPVHGTAHVGADGTFELPPAFAAELLTFSTMWATEHAQLADEERIELADLHDPDRALRLLANFRARVASLEALPAGERPQAAPWEPDEHTLGWVSMIVRDDQAGLRELAALRVEASQLAAAPAPAKEPAK